MVLAWNVANSYYSDLSTYLKKNQLIQLRILYPQLLCPGFLDLGFLFTNVVSAYIVHAVVSVISKSGIVGNLPRSTFQKEASYQPPM